MVYWLRVGGELQLGVLPTIGLRVLAALVSLLRGINTSTGIGHPSDKARVIDIFRALRKARIPVDSSEIRAWLAQQGLVAKHADAIAAIAEDPGKFQRPGNSTMRADIAKVWKGEAT